MFKKREFTTSALPALTKRLDRSFPFMVSMTSSSRFFNSFGWQLFKDAIGLLCVVFICISVFFLGVIL